MKLSLGITILALFCIYQTANAQTPTTTPTPTPTRQAPAIMSTPICPTGTPPEDLTYSYNQTCGYCVGVENPYQQEYNPLLISPTPTYSVSPTPSPTPNPSRVLYGMYVTDRDDSYVVGWQVWSEYYNLMCQSHTGYSNARARAVAVGVNGGSDSTLRINVGGADRVVSPWSARYDILVRTYGISNEIFSSYFPGLNISTGVEWNVADPNAHEYLTLLVQNTTGNHRKKDWFNGTSYSYLLCDGYVVQEEDIPECGEIEFSEDEITHNGFDVNSRNLFRSGNWVSSNEYAGMEQYLEIIPDRVITDVTRLYTYGGQGGMSVGTGDSANVSVLQCGSSTWEVYPFSTDEYSHISVGFSEPICLDRIRIVKPNLEWFYTDIDGIRVEGCYDVDIETCDWSRYELEVQNSFVTVGNISEVINGTILPVCYNIVSETEINLTGLADIVNSIWSGQGDLLSNIVIPRITLCVKYIEFPVINIGNFRLAISDILLAIIGIGLIRKLAK